MHLPIFTEVLGYNQKIDQVQIQMKSKPGVDGETYDNHQEQDEDEIEKDQEMRGFESDEDDEIEEPHGIKGMTL